MHDQNGFEPHRRADERQRIFRVQCRKTFRYSNERDS